MTNIEYRGEANELRINLEKRLRWKIFIRATGPAGSLDPNFEHVLNLQHISGMH